MFELWSFKRTLAQFRFTTRWTAWKKFSISKYANHFATATRDPDTNDLLYLFEHAPEHGYEHLAWRLAESKGFVLVGGRPVPPEQDKELDELYWDEVTVEAKSERRFRNPFRGGKKKDQSPSDKSEYDKKSTIDPA